MWPYAHMSASMITKIYNAVTSVCFLERVW